KFRCKSHRQVGQFCARVNTSAFWKGASMVCAGSILCWLATRGQRSTAPSSPERARWHAHERIHEQ
ncbi:hypothetical protein C2U34_15385, partial [Ralstonia solanacearum]